jgi:hypothetical protein
MSSSSAAAAAPSPSSSSSCQQTARASLGGWQLLRAGMLEMDH